MSLLLPALSWVASLPASSKFPAALAGFVAIYWLTRRNLSYRTELSTQTMSPDTVSSLFPDRPIRPLPKRRLRERLSPEAADSIKYPSSTLDSIPLFYYPPYTLKEEVNHTNRETISSVEQPRPTEAERSLASRQTKTGLGESVEEDDAPRSTLVTRSPPEILNRVTRLPVRPDQPRLADPQPPPSAASSVDGYDSFENTNNKKKRKIPSAGDSTLNGAHSLNSDVGSLSISTGVRTDVVVNGERSYPESAGYASSSGYLLSSHGVSGPGRGRLGRSRNGRSPLRTLPDGNSTWLGRVPKNGPPQWPSGMWLTMFFLFTFLRVFHEPPALRSWCVHCPLR